MISRTEVESKSVGMPSKIPLVTLNLCSNSTWWYAICSLDFSGAWSWMKKVCCFSVSQLSNNKLSITMCYYAGRYYSTPPLELDEAARIWESIISHVLSIQLGPFHNDVTNNSVVTWWFKLKVFPPPYLTFYYFPNLKQRLKWGEFWLDVYLAW